MQMTLPLLRGIVTSLKNDQALQPIDQLMVATANALAFFGFLHCGGLLALILNEVGFENNAMPNLKLTIAKSKTDPFRQGCMLYVGPADPTNAAICPARLIRTYVDATNACPSNRALFACPRRDPSTRKTLSQWPNER